VVVVAKELSMGEKNVMPDEAVGDAAMEKALG